MDAINQKEYLKKYLGIGKVPGEKKKKKLRGVANRITIIDDDAETAFAKNMMEEDPLLASEDAPQIVAIIDERPPSLRVDEKTKNPLWQPIGTTETHNATEQKQMITGFKITSKTNDKPFARPVDRSPPRKRKIVVDYSPPRKLKNEEFAPPQKRTEVEDSPPRYKVEDYSLKKSRIDCSPLQKSRDHDYSPPRRSRSENSSPSKSRSDDHSPPRKLKNYDSSAPAKQRNDNSPQRISRSENSSPRKSKSDDYSPPRKAKKYDISPARNPRNHNNSPPRKSRSENSSPRKPRNDDYSPPRKQKKYDISPPRKARNEDNSPKKSKSSPKYSKNDFSPLRRPRSDISSPKKSKTREYSPSRKQGRSKSENKDDSRKNKHSDESNRPDKMEKTLDGKAAGLQNAEQLVEETKQFRNREDHLFKNLSQDVSGENADTVFRDRKTGKIRNLAEEEERQRKKREEEEKNKEKYSRWGRGLVQVENRNQRIQEELYEMSKPLARYADDEDLEKFLKDQEREGDPMLAYIRGKKRKEAAKAGVVVKPQFEGQFMPNRFGIKPGHRWDGVDRSNGYEKRWFEVQNAKRAQQEDVYKWSTEDM